MSEMAYVARSNKSFAETVEAVSVAAERVGWAVLAVHDMRGRFCAKGFDWDPGLTIVELCKSGYASAMVAVDPRLALHLPCPVVVREDDDGVEVAVLQPVFVDGLFPATDFGNSAAQAQAEVNAIVDEAAS
jgi:uncharacterized protein (DUF302 family)